MAEDEEEDNGDRRRRTRGFRQLKARCWPQLEQKQNKRMLSMSEPYILENIKTKSLNQNYSTGAIDKAINEYITDNKKVNRNTNNSLDNKPVKLDRENPIYYFALISNAKTNYKILNLILKNKNN